jgi:hypothetical protein
MMLDLQLPMQSVHSTTNVVSTISPSKERTNSFSRLLVTKLIGYICITILHPKRNGV